MIGLYIPLHWNNNIHQTLVSYNHNLFRFMQTFEDPFGDGPFRATSSADNFPAQQQNVASTTSFHPSSDSFDPSHQTSPKPDVLADILPPSASQPNPFPSQAVQPSSQSRFQGQDQSVSVTGFQAQSGQSSPQTSYPVQMGQPTSMMGYSGQHAPQAGFPHPIGQNASFTSFESQMGTSQHAGFSAPSQPAQPGANFYGNFNQQGSAPRAHPITPHTPDGPPAQYNTVNFNQQSSSQVAPQMQQAGLSAHHRTSSLPDSSNSRAIVPQPAKDEFKTKSTVWTDTLNRGLVNLNISGCELDCY